MTNEPTNAPATNEPATNESALAPPWASSAARERIAEVASRLPDLSGPGFSTDAVVRTVTTAVRRQTQRFDTEGMVLYAGTNTLSPAARTVYDAAVGLGSRPSMGWPGEKYQTGLDDLDRLEVLTSALLARLSGGRFAEVRSQSATLANLAVYYACARPGDTIAVLPERAGGHASHHAYGAPGVRGLRVVDLPYDAEAYDVDVDALPGFLARERPRVVVIGASLMLFPHRMSALARPVAEAGALLVYDASHLAGLVAAGRFQRPLREGARVLTFSTYKSFGGPPGGVIVTDEEELAERISTAVYPGLTANYDVARLAPLAVTAAEILADGGAYADRCVAGAQAFARALHEQGLTVAGADRGFTESHHLAIDTGGSGAAAAARLAAAGIYLSAVGLPSQNDGDPARGLRIGTQEVTRRGIGPDALARVAVWMADVLLRDADPEAIRKRVAALREEHRREHRD